MMSNPLLHSSTLPAFQEISSEQVQPAVEQIIAENRKQIKELLSTTGSFNWANLVAPLEELNDRLNKAWSPVSHMNAVVNSDELREAYNACLPLLSEYATELGQDNQLYSAFQAIAEGGSPNSLSPAQGKHIENTLRDFRLAGVSLSQEKKQRYAEIKQGLSKLSSRFSEHVLDATQAWSKLITDIEALAGVPDSALAAMQQAAEQHSQQGYLITLDYPSYFPIMTYCENSALREEVYHAYVTRASDRGPNAGQWDNTELIDETLALRHELALLLDFDNYAAYSLATKMADTPARVMKFLEGLAERSLPAARKELVELEDFARSEFQVEQLNAWDLNFYSEQLRQQRYDLSQEELRPYFPADRVTSGMFAVVERLYGIRIEPRDDVEIWHPEVKFYQIFQGDRLLGQFYLDLYARSNKRGGAWMDECRVRRRLDNGQIQLPVAYLTCNFNGPVGDDPALLTHNEVTTLFHEFGHGLHHLLTRVEVGGVSGINGVPWDAVELPSQFMENWCWQPEAIVLIAKHYQSGEALPSAMLDKLLAAKNFQSGMQMVRQLEFALFDFRLHLEYQPAASRTVQSLLDEVRSQVAVTPQVEYNRFQHGFSHIFAGGYGAGYYSYKWAELLAADAFARFEEEGIFNVAAGRSFLDNILSQGGIYEPMDLFVKFRGREPEVDALLKSSGLIEGSFE